METVNQRIAYKNAFNCKKCPGTSDETGCPYWWEFTAFDQHTGKEILRKQCGITALPKLLTEVIIASNRPAAAIESLRNHAMKSAATLNAVLAETYKAAGLVPNGSAVENKSANGHWM